MAKAGVTHSIPADLRRKPRGSKAGVKVKSWRADQRRRFKPSIPSVMMGNVNALANKMDELSALINRRIYRESSLFIFTETWLTCSTPDANVELPGFTSVRADRDTKACGKSKGGGLIVYVNNRWCNPGHVTVKVVLCCQDLELLAVSLRPYYLPREFSHVIVIGVYIPPRADAAAACEKIHSTTAKLQTQHPEAFIAISGDFNHATLDSTLPAFHQFVDCPTRKNRTIDLLYANVKDAYTATPHPPLGKSDHDLVHLQPQYTPLVQRQPATRRSLRIWSPEAEDALRDCFETTDWSVLQSPHGEDIEGLTHCLTDYLNFCMDVVAPARTVRCFPNNKPWVTRGVKAVLNKKKAAFRRGDKEAMKAAQREVKVCLRDAKESYRRKVEQKLQENNMREVWNGVKTITGYKAKSSSEGGTLERANELNNFFNRYLGLVLDNKLDWSKNTDHLYRKGQSRLYFLRRLRSFNICRKLLWMFYQSVVASVLFYAVVCWGGSTSKRDSSRLDKLIRRAGSVVGMKLDSLVSVAEERTLNKLLDIMDNVSHPLHTAITDQRSSFSDRLLLPRSNTNRLKNSFVPRAIKLYNSTVGCRGGSGRRKQDTTPRTVE
ncbi:hypothetical protein N1851_025941 [Merluccius polli]|uniref:Alkylated DNA repair protein AlkB homologue 8 N-terminal domain-containing protein n=1 Tax=Merluccius polli TaxID=89951 RepID=A0AA47MCZ0_MERPO|nr:hypothetical protein N1851_025941 [Merluccius polli]